MNVNRNLLGPKSWREVPIYWWEGLKFWLEMKVTKRRKKGGDA